MNRQPSPKRKPVHSAKRSMTTDPQQRVLFFQARRHKRKERWREVMANGTTCRGWHRPFWESSATRRRDKEASL